LTEQDESIDNGSNSDHSDWVASEQDPVGDDGVAEEEALQYRENAESVTRSVMTAKARNVFVIRLQFLSRQTGNL
jgi:hypothetical protein